MKGLEPSHLAAPDPKLVDKPYVKEFKLISALTVQ